MKKRIMGKLIILLIVFSLISTHPIFVFGEDSSDEHAEYLKSVMDMIKEKYNGEITYSQLIEGALKGMFDSMDIYTTYYTPDEADSFMESINGTYEGIGATLTEVESYVMILQVFKLSPAEKAGIIQGDKIASVNGKDMIGVSAEEAATLIRGEEDTVVTLGILRKGYSQPLIIDVERGKVEINPVSYEIRGDIGYIKLDTFNSITRKFFNEALEEIDNNNIKSVILDLRGNSGGQLNQTIAVAKKLVPEGVITKLEFASEKEKDIIYMSSLEETKYELAVLVDGMSASAAEILAGAIQDTGAGILIGTKTFGKAKVQHIIPILNPEAFSKYRQQVGEDITDSQELISKYGIKPDDSEIIGWTKITTGLYTTPNGRMIDGKGIEPDIIIENPEVNGNIDIKSIEKLTAVSKPGLNDEGTDIYNAEKILFLLGYDVDTPDIILDNKTFEAVSKFRVDMGLYPGGVLDFSTQYALNDKLDELILQFDKQYSKAVEILTQ